MYSLVALSTFTLLGNHHYHSSSEIFYFLKLKLCTHNTSSLTPFLQTLTITILSSVSVNLTTLGTFHISGILQYLPFWVWLISLSIMSSGFIHFVVYTRISFILRLNNLPFYVCATFCLSTFGCSDMWFEDKSCWNSLQ